ncbi:hypothetical protein F5Y19DRAFT_277685 [Xylariaceae sp. FL1651]|nr:hypothetical protein F5Y19DRAFT_277685 [Xylariaceae sp. FL1651]
MATRYTCLTRQLSHARPSSIFARQPQYLQANSRYASSFQSGPSPPRLPAEQQAEFERLQRTANTQQGFNATSSPDFSSLENPSKSTLSSAAATTTSAQTQSQDAQDIPVEINMEMGSAPTPLRKGAPPEFEGDVNPRTGEVGGPKNEPLRWGAGGDYSFNGRVTDF